MLRNKLSVNSTRRSEVRLTVQVAGLMIAFVLVFVYNVGQYIILKTLQVSILKEWRSVNPITNGFLSWVQPWSCLFFNKDVQTRIKELLSCGRRTAMQAHSGTFKTPASMIILPYRRR
ncbi:hypothetical protein OESDEN_03146 [Oesophagostomum dentatum]|uniref:Uncharacterized protein n=1 Tax=Oesophagostomum dentatum TaxID=61180 RepID=A0A0B1TM25_OESDE|nr:hypothetical protein OESDEN_03146 [Oesophagostomum dentatum]